MNNKPADDKNDDQYIKNVAERKWNPSQPYAHRTADVRVNAHAIPFLNKCWKPSQLQITHDLHQ